MNQKTAVIVGVAVVCGVLIGHYLAKSSEKKQAKPVWQGLLEAAVAGAFSGAASVVCARSIATA